MDTTMTTKAKTKRPPVGSCYDNVKTVTRHRWAHGEFGFAANISNDRKMLTDCSMTEFSGAPNRI